LARWRSMQATSCSPERDRAAAHLPCDRPTTLFPHPLAARADLPRAGSHLLLRARLEDVVACSVEWPRAPGRRRRHQRNHHRHRYERRSSHRRPRRRPRRCPGTPSSRPIHPPAGTLRAGLNRSKHPTGREQRFSAASAASQCPLKRGRLSLDVSLTGNAPRPSTACSSIGLRSAASLS
jgi:hypothetical protein